MSPNKSLASNKKEMAPLVFPRIAPEKMAADYLHSKKANAVTKKFPEWDLPRSEPSMEVVSRKKDLFMTEGRLRDRRREAIRQRDEMDNQWKDLESKELVLRENFLKFNKFVKENQEKRERAERKSAEERELIRKRNEDIEEVQKNYEYMTNIRQQMERNIRAHTPYGDYLQAIVKEFPTFRTVEDIIDRYEALQEARKELTERQEADLNALEEARNDMLKLTEEKSLIILGLNNNMAELQSRYETAKTKALQWEMMVVRIKIVTLQKMAEVYDVRESSWRIYLQMCARKEIEPEFIKDDVENQMLFIRGTLLELKRITKMAKRRAYKEYSLVGSQTSTFK